MFDLTDHQTMTDYMRIAVYNTSDPFATEAIGNIDWNALKGQGGKKGGRTCVWLCVCGGVCMGARKTGGMPILNTASVVAK